MRIDVQCHYWQKEHEKILIFAESRLSIIEDRVRLGKTREYNRYPIKDCDWMPSEVPIESLQDDLERTRIIVEQIKACINY